MVSAFFGRMNDGVSLAVDHKGISRLSDDDALDDQSDFRQLACGNGKMVTLGHEVGFKQRVKRVHYMLQVSFRASFQRVTEFIGNNIGKGD